MATGRSRLARARDAAVAAPRKSVGVPSAARLRPSAASVACGLMLLVLGAAGYGAARATSVFAVKRIDVRGADPELAAKVRHALRPIVGTSLVGLDGAALVRRVESVPWVAAVGYDRAFPHTVTVAVRPERPVAVLRRGAERWLVSARGRVLESVDRGGRPGLPRIWSRPVEPLAAGDLVADRSVGVAVSAVAITGSTVGHAQVRSVRAAPGELVYLLASGLELRLAGLASLRLKAAVGAEIIPALPSQAEGGPTYLDLTVPDRPVAGRTLKSKVEVDGSAA